MSHLFISFLQEGVGEPQTRPRESDYEPSVMAALSSHRKDQPPPPPALFGFRGEWNDPALESRLQGTGHHRLLQTRSKLAEPPPGVRSPSLALGCGQTCRGGRSVRENWAAGDESAGAAAVPTPRPSLGAKPLGQTPREPAPLLLRVEPLAVLPHPTAPWAGGAPGAQFFV